MPTFLTTRKMPPELRARIEASLHTSRSAPGRRVAPGVLALLRLLLLCTVVGLVTLVIWWRKAESRAFDVERAALLERVTRASEGLTARDRERFARALEWLLDSNRPYQGDRVTPDVRDLDALTRVLNRPLVYVRGRLAGFDTRSGIAETASTSFKDAFVLCLLDPPPSPTEAALRRRALDALAGGERADAIAHVERLHTALSGLPLLLPDGAERIEAARDRLELARLESVLQKAPLAAAVRAAKADSMLLVLDEPQSVPGPSELDGTAPHLVRIELVDLERERVLLRLRRAIDPEWISPGVRAEFAGPITSCQLALAVREAVETAGESPPRSPE